MYTLVVGNANAHANRDVSRMDGGGKRYIRLVINGRPVNTVRREYVVRSAKRRAGAYIAEKLYRGINCFGATN